MVMAPPATRMMGPLLALGLCLGLTGCDYWPPALQTQIEQLRSELQMMTAERVQLQTQLASISKVKDDLQAQVDDLNRSNRDKSTMITSLQNTVTTLQDRLNKSTKTATKVTAPKPPAKKKTAHKPSGMR